MPSGPASRRRASTLESREHGRRIAGGLASLGLLRSHTVAVLLRHDPVYLSIAHACGIGGFRIRQISAHSTSEQIVSAMAEPGIRAVFAHEDFLPALAGLQDEVAVIAVTPLSLFPGHAPAAAGLRFHAYHQWLPLQAERAELLPGRRTRPGADSDSLAVSGNAYRACRRMLDSLTRAADGRPPRAGGASPRSAGNPAQD